MTPIGDTSASGIVEGRFEGISPLFTDVCLLSEGDINILGKGKRYGRWWLLKGLQPDLSELTQYVEMLHKEFELLMKAQHPGIVQATGLEDVPGLGECIVMEYVEGSTLKQRIGEGLNRSEAGQIVDELLDTVAYIHSIGVVHRDLKPSNIIVTHSCHVKLIDFGLADTHAHAFLKQSAGTERYMSPEQAAGGKPDARNDIYSLGVVLRAMDLNRDYKKVAARCILPIEERYQSVEEIKNDLSHMKSTRRTMMIGATALLLAGLLAGTAIVASRLNNNTRYVRDDKARQQVDSLRNELNQTTDQMELSQLKQDSLRRHLGGLNDTIMSLNASNIQLRNTQKELDEP